MNKVAFDGQVYAQSTAGAYRYCNEILKEFDHLIKKGEYSILIPRDAMNVPRFQNLKIINVNGRGLLWGQICLPLYCLKNNITPISFYNITSLIRPGIVVVHDVAYKVLSKSFTNIYGRLSSLWHRLNYWIIAKSEQPIITVSEFSKKEISEIYHVNEKRITVIGNAWDHYNHITRDDSILDELFLNSHEYFLGLGGSEKRKNFKWIIEVARRNPKEIFVIVGKVSKNNEDISNNHGLNNVIFTGFLKDDKVKSLVSHAKAFLFPSTYEGFGIPPLEALSVGTKVLCSNTSCLPEICGEAVAYFDPYDYEVNLDHLLGLCDLGKRETVLMKYSWKKSAENLYDFVKRVNS